MINEGENLGLIKTRMIKSVRNSVIEYFANTKSFLNIIRITDIKIKRNRIPAAALISLSFKTGILYPFTCSPNCITLFMFDFLLVLNKDIFWNTRIKIDQREAANKFM